MGQVPSTVYKFYKKAVIRYNANYRAEKFLEKGLLPHSPRYPSEIVQTEKTHKSELKKIHEKNEQLNEHLKKVYLTSTSTITGTPSKRPKPKKENELKARQNQGFFVEPKQVQPNHATLSTIINILFNYHEESKDWNVKTITRNFNLNKADVEKLILHCSLFTKIDLNFLNADKETDDKEEPQKVEFEVYTALEKKPLRQITGKK